MKIYSLLTADSLMRLAKDYILVSLALLGALTIGRLFEVGLLLFYHSGGLLDFWYFMEAFLRDLQSGVLIGFVLLLFWRGIRRLSPEKGLAITAILVTVIGGVNALLIIYFNATLTPLGPEFWAYSLREMTNTVLASDRLSIWGILLFIVVIIGVYRLIRSILTLDLANFSTGYLIGGVSFAVLLLVTPLSWLSLSGQPAASSIQANKLAYFITASLESSTAAVGTPVTSEVEKEYPFLHATPEGDVLGPFFKDLSEPPNIVFLIVESLGGEFIGSRGQWTGFAPNLDSLARSGLYWENGLSLSGRTFGMMPSLFGSLPPGSHGFMDLGPEYPNHHTLISLLDRQGYHTSFFSGFNTYFDKLDFFLEYQGIDFVLNTQNIEQNYLSDTREGTQNYWGYDDKTMLQVASAILDTAGSFPRLDIYHTLQSHSPFTVPDTKTYEATFDRLVDSMDISEPVKASYRKYRAELTTLMYSDDAIGEFMDFYSKKKHYSNTIFIITGDHWLIPVPQTSQLSRYHVPIIIFSPLLKRPIHFESVNTHANITPALTSLLQQQSGLSFPDSVHWLGTTMDTSRIFRNIHSIPLMKNKNQLTDFVSGDFYLSDDRLYQLKDNFHLAPSYNTEKKDQLVEQLQKFKARNQYVVRNDKLTPSTTSRPISSRHAFITAYDTLFQRIDSLGLTVDEQFQQARQLAFEGKYELARAVAKRLLLAHPGYHDVQLLVGRTHAWEGNYEEARGIFKEVIGRSPEYDDSYNALFDLEYWDGNLSAALKTANEGLQYHPSHAMLLEKKIRVLVELQNKGQARKTYNTLAKNHPNHNNLPELKRLVSD